MNKLIKLLAASSALCLLFAGCAKQDKANPYEGEALPTVSISGDSQFVMDEANLTLTLSHMIHKDVTVVFDVTGIEREALNLPETGVIQAGSVKKVIPVQIDEDKASIGSKTVTVTLKEADYATLATASTSLSANIEDIAMVNVAATAFDENLESTLTFTLSKKVTKDVVLAVSYDTKDGSERAAFPAANLTFDDKVTIPAGSKVGTMKVQAVKTGIPEGSYQVHFTVGSYGANAKAGAAPDANLILNVGFQPTLASTSILYFQYYNYYWYINYDNVPSHAYFFLWAEEASAGSTSDPAYVKDALYRCRDFIQKESNRNAVQAYWDYYYSAGYTSVPRSTPMAVSETGYRGWPMLYQDGKGVVDMVSGTTYHVFMVGFDEELNVCEEYFVTDYTES